MSILYFILVLGITVLIHELGHYIFAKRAGVHVYEFAIGMGPKIYGFKRKNDETIYSIRLFPIGGFVSMAGEDLEADNLIPKDKQLCNKTWFQRFTVMIAGIAFNFILAIILLFIVGLANGVPKEQPTVAFVDENYPIYNTSITVGDEILKIDNAKIRSSDRLILELSVNTGKTLIFSVRHADGEIEKVNVKPILVEKGDTEGYSYGFSLDSTKTHGIIPSIKYAFTQTRNLVEQMTLIVTYLVTGKLNLNNLAGPIGIYTIVSDAASAGIINVIYLIAYLCINVGFINFIPFPAFDGGRILFLIIEKIKGSKVNPKIENLVHTVGFMLLMALMVFITINDIGRFFS